MGGGAHSGAGLDAVGAGFAPFVCVVGGGDEIHVCGVCGPVEARFVGDGGVRHVHCVSGGGDFGGVPGVCGSVGDDGGVD